MTPAQTIALATPCYLGGETIAARYRSGNGRWSQVLTVNSGYE
jgi:hypothetical protein